MSRLFSLAVILHLSPQGIKILPIDHTFYSFSSPSYIQIPWGQAKIHGLKKNMMLEIVKDVLNLR